MQIIGKVRVQNARVRGVDADHLDGGLRAKVEAFQLDRSGLGASLGLVVDFEALEIVDDAPFCRAALADCRQGVERVLDGRLLRVLGAERLEPVRGDDEAVKGTL